MHRNAAATSFYFSRADSVREMLFTINRDAALVIELIAVNEVDYVVVVSRNPLFREAPIADVANFIHEVDHSVTYSTLIEAQLHVFALLAEKE